MPSHSASGGGPGSGGGSGGGDGDGGEPGEGGCEGGVGGTFGGPSTNHATAFSNAGLSKNIVVCAISLVAISASSSYEWVAPGATANVRVSVSMSVPSSLLMVGIRKGISAGVSVNAANSPKGLDCPNVRVARARSATNGFFTPPLRAPSLQEPFVALRQAGAVACIVRNPFRSN